MIFIPAKERDGEVAFVRAFWTADVKFTLVLDEDVLSPQKNGSTGISDHKLP